METKGFLLRLTVAAAALVGACFSLSAQEKLEVGEGEKEVLYASGKQLGVWRPDSRVFVMSLTRSGGERAGQHVTLTFRENGEVWSDLGKQVGIIDETGLVSSTTGGLKNIRINAFYVLKDGTEIGRYYDGTGTLFIHGQKLVTFQTPMDPQALAFVTLCVLMDEDMLASFKNAKKSSAQQQSGGSSASQNASSGRRASRIEVSGSEFRALDGNGRTIGRASYLGGSLYVYNGTGGSVSRGCIRQLGNEYTIDFRGTTNVYRVTKLGDTWYFKDDRGLDVGKVTHNTTMKWYEASRTDNSVSQQFPDTVDPMAAAMLFYRFFD